MHDWIGAAKNSYFMIAVNEALILSVVQKVLKNPVGQFEFPNNSPTKFAFSSIKKKHA